MNGFVPHGFITLHAAMDQCGETWFAEEIKEIEERETRRVEEIKKRFAADGRSDPLALLSLTRESSEHSAEVERLALASIHKMQGHLFSGDLIAGYFDGRWPELHEIERSVWATEDGTRIIAEGRYWPWGHSRNAFQTAPNHQILVWKIDVEALLNGDIGALRNRHTRQKADEQDTTVQSAIVDKDDALHTGDDSTEEEFSYQYRSGGPGRPSSANLVWAEFQKRRTGGDCEPSLSREAKALADWLQEVHPLAPSLKQGTIENQIRSAFRKKD